MKNSVFNGLLFVCLLTITGCHKQNPSLGPYYEQLIGIWENEEYDLRVEFSKKGKISAQKAVERGIIFQATGCVIRNRDNGIVQMGFHKKGDKEFFTIYYHETEQEFDFNGFFPIKKDSVLEAYYVHPSLRKL